eukprot:tig00021586_g22671.t1
MTKGHSMMDIGEGSKKQRQSLKNDLKGEVTGIIEKYAPGTIMPEVPVLDPSKADVYTPEDVARGLGVSGTNTKALPAMKYTPQMEKLMRMGIRQQLQNAHPGRTINEEDVENAFSLRKEIMIRDFDQWAMTAFDLKQPGVAKMLEEYYPELLERITNMIEQDIEITRFDKYQKVFFPMNYDDLVMKWARERGWIKTMEEIERENLLGPAGRYGQNLRAGYTPDLSPMFNAQTARLTNAANTPYGRKDIDFSKGNPFEAVLMDMQGTRGPAISTAVPYHDQNLLPAITNPIMQEANAWGADGSMVRQINDLRRAGPVNAGEDSLQERFRTTFQNLVGQGRNNQLRVQQAVALRAANAYTAAAAQQGRYAAQAAAAVAPVAPVAAPNPFAAA